MSKKQHQRQLDKARAKRQATAQQRRSARNKIVIAVMAGLMVLSLFVAPLLSLLGG